MIKECSKDDDYNRAMATIDSQKTELNTLTDDLQTLNTRALEYENTIAVQKTTIENLMNKNCPPGTVSKDDKSKAMVTTDDVDKDKAATIDKDHVRVIIDMDSKGTYTIKEWHDPKMDYELDGMILEIFKDDAGTLKMVSWTEEELLDISKEMLTFWDDDEFWDQVVIGYIGTDGVKSEFNMYDDAMKKWRKHRKQQKTAEKEKGKKKVTKWVDLKTVEYKGYVKG